MTNSRRDVLAKLTGTKQVHRLHKAEGSKQKAEALKSHYCSCLLLSAFDLCSLWTCFFFVRRQQASFSVHTQ